MKKIFIIFIIFICTKNFAQQPGYISGEASVNLIVPLSVQAGSGDLDFGEIIVTGSAFTEKIEPFSGKQFIVIGHPGRNVTIRFNAVELKNYSWASLNGGKLAKLTFIPKVITKNSQSLTDGSSFKLLKSGLVGELQVFVGGEISISSKQPIGQYEGLFILSVTY
jgi:hypothetical protein